VADGGEEQPPAPVLKPDAATGDGIGDLFRRLVDDAEAFVRAEVKLYRAEAIHRLETYKSLFAMGAIGIVLGLGAVILLLFALVFALAPYTGPAWASVIVAVLSFSLSGLLFTAIFARLRGKDGPDEKEDPA